MSASVKNRHSAGETSTVTKIRQSYAMAEKMQQNIAP